jgi:hypothetical protein
MTELIEILRGAERVLAPWKSNHPNPRIAMAQQAGHFETAAAISRIYIRQAIEILQAAERNEHEKNHPNTPPSPRH